ncbi:MAG TPA: DNA recombination protein RmuC [Sphingomicrobium sp.]|nr:DNA recombination protein RmuC [Sphingomicrobium sp.]
MTTFEVIVLIGFVIVIGLGITAIALLLRSATPKLEPKLEAIERQLSDSIGIVNLAISGLRDEVSKSAAALREEVSARIEGLGTNLQATLANIGTQQAERLDALAAEQTRRFDSFGTALTDHRTASAKDSKSLRDEVQTSLLALGRKVTENLEMSGTKQTEALAGATAAIKELSNKNEEKQEALRRTVEGRLDSIRTENAEKLEQMRVTVDEKLQGTLEQRLGASFSQVNENLERVFKSVGEMQTLAVGVGDLKRVLSHVKLRGTWGEGVLGAILEQGLTPEQYSQNVEVRPQSGQRVEYAIRLPGQEEGTIWLPIDSKLPQGDYERLTLAAEQGDTVAVDQASRSLEKCIIGFARDIASKYICPPYTTDFAVMFLPSEGLFAEVVRRPGLVDQLQREHRVAVTGPTTLNAFINSLRMGFRSLAIQQRSSEVWQVLSAVKTEFGKFGEVFDKVHKKLNEAQNVVESAKVRRNAMERKLRDVESLPEAAAQDVLSISVQEIIDEAEIADEAAE